MGRREAAGNGATGRSVEAFQFGDIGNAQERKPSAWGVSEKNPEEKLYTEKREELLRGTP